MEKSTRPVLLHYHIFKNAGLTFGLVLEKNFDNNHVRMDDDKGNVLSEETVKSYLLENPTVCAFSCHKMEFPIKNSNNMKFINIIFVRHPTDRACSIYNYNKREKIRTTIGVKQAKALPMGDYIIWMLNSKNFIMREYQTTYLNGFSTGNFDLKTALDNLKNCPIIGVVDRYDESMVVAEDTLKEYFPKIDLSYIMKNVSNPNDTSSFSEKLNKNQSKLGIDIVREFESKNKNDFKVYQEANKILDEKILKIENFNNKLLEFKERCKNYRESFNLNKENQTKLKFKHSRVFYSSEKKEAYIKNKFIV